MNLDPFPKTMTFNVTPINDAPVVTVPGALSVNEDIALVFDGGAAISISDVDAESNQVLVSLIVANGKLTLGSTDGLSFIDGTANGTTSLKFYGTVADINAALAGLSYLATTNYYGTDAPTVTVSDEGHTGGASRSL